MSVCAPDNLTASVRDNSLPGVTQCILAAKRRFLYVATPSKGKKHPCDAILGSHPSTPDVLAECLTATNALTDHGAPHRKLDEVTGKRKTLVKATREMLITHHLSEETINREKKRAKAFANLGFKNQAAKVKRFPTNALRKREISPK